MRCVGVSPVATFTGAEAAVATLTEGLRVVLGHRGVLALASDDDRQRLTRGDGDDPVDRRPLAALTGFSADVAHVVPVFVLSKDSRGPGRALCVVETTGAVAALRTAHLHLDRADALRDRDGLGVAGVLERLRGSGRRGGSCRARPGLVTFVGLANACRRTQGDDRSDHRHHTRHRDHAPRNAPEHLDPVHFRFTNPYPGHTSARAPARKRSVARQILEHRHRRVASVDRDHAPAGVGAGPTQVETVGAEAGREPAVPHLVGQALALEDVPTGEADLRLDVGRAEHLTVDDAFGDVGRERGRSSSSTASAISSRRSSQVPDVRSYGTNCANTLIVCAPGGATDASYGVWK